MPALLILAVISWLFGSGKPRSQEDAPPIFTALEVRPRRRWNSFSYSIAAHAVCITLLFLSSDLFGTSDDDFRPKEATKHALVIRLPNHLDLAPAPPDRPVTADLEKRTPPVAIRRKDLRKYTEEGSQAKLIEPPAVRDLRPEPSLFSAITPLPEPPKVEPKKFELPDIPVKTTAKQTILQAEMPPVIPVQIDKKLPQLAFWDAEASKPPNRPVEPGNRKLRVEAPRLASVPLLEAPNLELKTSDLKMASAPVPKSAALTLPPATTMPLRMLQPGKDAVGPTSIDPFTGEPVNVIALSANPAPLTDALKSLLIPAGNQMARLPGATPFFGFPGPGGGPDGSGGSSANSADGGDGGGKGATGHGPGDGRLFGILNPPGVNGTPLRIIHPNNGVFDIVVVQNSTSESFPDAAAALSGRPIYTVYLQVGATKEWVLQFCVPDASGPVQTGGLVSLGKPAPIGAPYPMVTVRPPEDWQHGSDYLLVHGFLDESGRFRDLRILPGEAAAAPTTGALLDYLGYWEFRPAVRDGRPVKVEVILAVPPDHLS
jgi:hypothetical protein